MKEYVYYNVMNIFSNSVVELSYFAVYSKVETGFE